MATVAQEDRRRQDRERLEQATKALIDSDGWQAWLEARGKFHHYSLGNQLLIAWQSPEASQVAGYKTWQKLGRQVRKGEKGIRILAPVGGPCKSCAGQGGKHFDGDFLTCSRCIGTGRWGGFKSVSVFDVSQTDGDDLPEIPREPLTGDSHAEYLPMLEGFASSLGYSVEYQDTGSKGGWCDYSAKAIVVSESRSPNGKVRTLIHEIAHALGIGYDYGREVAEVIVESVAYVVASSVGLDTSSETLAYLASWGDGDVKALKAYAQTIDELAGKIETALGLGRSESQAA